MIEKSHLNEALSEIFQNGKFQDVEVLYAQNPDQSCYFEHGNGIKRLYLATNCSFFSELIKAGLSEKNAWKLVINHEKGHMEIANAYGLDEDVDILSMQQYVLHSLNIENTPKISQKRALQIAEFFADARALQSFTGKERDEITKTLMFIRSKGTDDYHFFFKLEEFNKSNLSPFDFIRKSITHFHDSPFDKSTFHFRRACQQIKNVIECLHSKNKKNTF